MAAFNFWYMLNLHRGKVVLVFFLAFFLSFVAMAQREKVKKGTILSKNLPNYDDRKMHYGFYLGGVATKLNVEHSQSYVDSLSRGGIVWAANPKYSPGFTLGFVLSHKLGDYFTVRFLPGVGFFTRNVEFIANGGKAENVEVPSTTVQLPFMVKYTSKRRKNTRMYFVAGAAPTIDIGGSKRNERVDNQLRIDKNNFQVEYGVGVDLFYPFFKFAPELRIAHGIPNLLIPDNNRFARTFQSVSTTNVTLYLFFE
jgi:hypothetical protein